jgi:hypothetical protein
MEEKQILHKEVISSRNKFFILAEPVANLFVGFFTSYGSTGRGIQNQT